MNTTVAPAEAVEQPEFVGVITSRKSEIIPAPFTGRVKRLEVTPGQKVYAGDKIALLDDTDLKSEIQKKIAEERAASAQAGAGGAMAAYGKTQLKAVNKLVKLGSAPKIEIEKIKADINAQGAQSGAAAAQGLVAKASRDILERQLKGAQMTAPTGGIVMMVKAKEGAVVQQGEPIARVFDPRDLIVRFAVPKTYRDKLQTGARVELQIEGVKRQIWATIQEYADEEAPINFTVVVADLDDAKLGPGEVRLASVAKVKLVDVAGGKS